MYRLTRTVASAFIVYSIGSTSIAASDTYANAGIHLLDGKLYVNQALLIPSFSIARTDRGYLFFYLPEFGLITIGTAEFPDAKSSGTFKGSTVKFSTHGKDFLIEASRPILDVSNSPAWVHVDKSYSIETKSPMVGYGDSPASPYHWPRHIRNAE